jgi:hypothetical protein
MAHSRFIYDPVQGQFIAREFSEQGLPTGRLLGVVSKGTLLRRRQSLTQSRGCGEQCGTPAYVRAAEDGEDHATHEINQRYQDAEEPWDEDGLTPDEEHKYEAAGLGAEEPDPGPGTDGEIDGYEGQQQREYDEDPAWSEDEDQDEEKDQDDEEGEEYVVIEDDEEGRPVSAQVRRRRRGEASAARGKPVAPELRRELERTRAALNRVMLLRQWDRTERALRAWYLSRR